VQDSHYALEADHLFIVTDYQVEVSQYHPHQNTCEELECQSSFLELSNIPEAKHSNPLIVGQW
jgi:hypothetical protein